MKSKVPNIESFDFEPGHILLKKYEIISQLGYGWEGEVYLVKEINTGIEHAAKFFFPQQNKRNQTANRYAKKLHKLRHCKMVIQYFTHETFIFKGHPISFLISEYVEGELFSTFLKKQPGKRLPPFQALHFLYSLVLGMQEIHAQKEYHGDLHRENIIVNRFGLGFELKLLDLYSWDHTQSKTISIREDLCDVIDIFYEALGGRKYYSKQPKVIKNICCGLKRPLILKKFPTVAKLRLHLENLVWE